MVSRADLAAAIAIIVIVVLLIVAATSRSGSAYSPAPALTGESHHLPGDAPPSPAAVNVTASEGPVPTTPMPGTIYRGTATWYCGSGSPCTRGYGPSDMVAAIDRKDSEFRKGDRVLVRYGDRAVVVTIVDTCACVDRRVIDLSTGAFTRLAPLALGVIPVTLERADISLPETDGEQREQP